MQITVNNNKDQSKMDVIVKVLFAVSYYVEHNHTGFYQL
jgi:hypothetical protein